RHGEPPRAQRAAAALGRGTPALRGGLPARPGRPLRRADDRLGRRSAGALLPHARTAREQAVNGRAAPLVLFALAACGPSASPPWSEPPKVPVDLRIAAAPTEVRLLEPVTVDLD